MKKIINGKKYDTHTAEFLMETYRVTGRVGELYRKKTGEFFIVHNTSWEEETDTIEPISEDEAKKLIGEKDGDKYELIFGEVDE